MTRICAGASIPSQPHRYVRSATPPARSEPLTDTPPTSQPNQAIPLPAVFDRYREEVGFALRAGLAGDESPIRLMLSYAMGWVDVEGNPTLATEGKALRPTLCLLACEAAGGTTAEAMPAAVAMELVHNFSLIHDEIQDRDDVRRHRPTLWKVWGERKALVAGNVMRIVADMALWGHRDRETALAVAGLVTQATLEMIEGQYMDLHFEGRMDITMDDYLAMISRKTGALIRCSLVAGAAAGSGYPSTIEAFEESGRAFGMVFQVRDDYLAVWGVEAATGKPVGADVRRKKNAFPFVYAMSKAEGRDRDALLEIYGQPEVGDGDVAAVVEIMERLGARESAQELAAHQSDRAVQALQGLELAPEARRDIEELAHFLLVRDR